MPGVGPEVAELIQSQFEELRPAIEDLRGFRRFEAEGCRRAKARCGQTFVLTGTLPISPARTPPRGSSRAGGG